MTLESALQKLQDTIRLRHLSISTEEAYRSWLVRFARFVTERCQAAWSSEQKMEAFLTQLAHQGIAASTQNQAFCAILFFYRDALGIKVGDVNALRAKKPIHLRYAPERVEVIALLDKLTDIAGYPTRLIVKLIYGCGLRVNEPLDLRIKDVLLSDSRLVLRGAKGGKDRFVPIPCSLAGDLAAQIAVAKSVAQRDRLSQLPVQLPVSLARKYPHLQFNLKWGFVFPGHEPCIHPRTGVTVRYRCHEANVQRCVRAAARQLGLDITPHHLRHAYATHCLDAGANVRAIQEVMGHKNLETTQGYLHTNALSVQSPLDAMVLAHK